LNNFTAIRNGLLDHALAGKLSPFDFGLYVFLIMRAEYLTGIYQGCALTIAYQFGDPSQKEHIQKALRRLRDRNYVNYRNGDGSRGAYQILINKFDVTVGELCGTRLNAFKHGQLVKPEYERENGRGTVETLSWHRGDTVVTPNKDLKTEDVKTEDAQEKTFSSELGSSDPGTTTSSAKKRKPDPPSDKALRLAQKLHDEIAKNKPDFHFRESSLVSWAKTADLMMRRDGRSYERISALIGWVQGDQFWRANVLSMDKLREQFDRLEMTARSQRERKASHGNGKPSITEIIEREQAIVRGRGVQ